MHRPLAAIALIAALLVAAFAIAPTTLAGDPCFHSLDRPAATTGSTTSITVGECTFGPTVSHVNVGSEVIWTNSSNQPHEIVGANLAWGAHDKLIGPGDTIGWTFEEPGVYPYACMLHPGMTGAIVVGDAVAADLVPVAALARSEGGASAVGADTGGALAIAGMGAALLGLVALAGVVRSRRARGAGE